MSFPQSRHVSVGDVDLAVYEMGSGRPVVMVHGFPELAYSWRHQLPALAGAGYRAIAYDLRGYGDSSKPEGVEAYGLKTLVGDLVGLAEALDLEAPVVVGHDWGSIVTNSALVMRPGVFAAAASLNVPYRGWCSGLPSTEFITANAADRMGYILWFHDGDKADQAFAADPKGFLGRFYEGAGGGSRFMTDSDIAVYVDAMIAGGITGPLNYYRNIDANLAATANLANAPIDVPYLMIVADGDPVLPASLTDGMERWVGDLRRIDVPDCGHWIQQERPDAVNDALIGFLAEVA